MGWSTLRIELVAHAVKTHSFSASIKPLTLEAKILQDSDRLDAIGQWKAIASKPTVTDKVTSMSVGLAWHRERKFGPEMQVFSNCFHDSFLAPRQLSARR